MKSLMNKVYPFTKKKYDTIFTLRSSKQPEIHSKLPELKQRLRNQSDDQVKDLIQNNIYKSNDSTYGNSARKSYGSPRDNANEELKLSSHQRYRSIDAKNPYNTRNLSLNNLNILNNDNKAYLSSNETSNKLQIPKVASYFNREDRILISQRYHNFRNKQSKIVVNTKKNRKALDSSRQLARYA